MTAWSRRAWLGTAAGALAATALVSTWPLALHLGTALPLGSETTPAIPLFDLWTLWWGGGRLWHGYAEAWNAPIFHPTAGAFAFSEPMWLPGAIAAPLFPLGPALAHNLVLLLLLGSNGVFACRLARALAVPRAPALLAGMATVALPWVAKLAGELPLLGFAGFLATLDGLVRFGHDGRWRWLLAAAAGLVTQALSCQQLTLLALPFVVFATIVALHARGFERTALVRTAAIASATAAMLLALAWTPLRIHAQHHFTRDAALVESLSARPVDFLTRPATAILPPRSDADTGGLNPGFVLIALAGYGAFAAGRDPRTRRWSRYAVAAVVIAFWLALGLRLSLAGFRPYELVRVLPGFASLRSAYRAALFLQLHVVVLAAFGLAALPGRRAFALGALALLEGYAPARLQPLPFPDTPATAFLAAQPAGTVIAHVPFPASGAIEDLTLETWRMYAQIAHRKAMVNGYASYLPAVHRELMFAMARTFPDHGLACALVTALGAELLVVDQSWRRTHDLAPLVPLLTPIHDDASVAIYRLTPAPGECPPVRLDVRH
jgi:hypothetical protein